MATSSGLRENVKHNNIYLGYLPKDGTTETGGARERDLKVLGVYVEYWQYVGVFWGSGDITPHGTLTN